MMHNTFVVLIICLGPGLARPAAAHVGERVTPIVELSDADLARIDLHDGSIEDWQDILGEPTLTARDLTAIGPVSETFAYVTDYDPSDFDYRIWLGWHGSTSRIYAAMESIDDLYINRYDYNASIDPGQNAAPTIMFLHDSTIQLIIDANHSADEWVYLNLDLCNCYDGYDDWVEQSYQETQLYVAIGEAPDGNQISLFDLDPTLWATMPPFAEGGGASHGGTPTVSITEFYVTAFDWIDNKSAPEDSRRSTLTAGRAIGLDIHIYDVEPDLGQVRSWHTLTGGRESFSYGNLLGDALLVGRDGEVPNTTVEDVTWARIKAAFGD